MEKTTSDSWFTRRVMRLTHREKRFVNDPANAERVALPPQPQCLEIGCGQGAVTRLLVERYGARVIATDYDPEQVALAQKRLADLNQRVEFRIVDARAMPFNDTLFDGVFSFYVLHHVPGGWRQVVVETARVLKPGGWFIFADMIPAPRVGRLIRRLLPWLDPLEETALRTCMAQNGLRLEHYERGPGMLVGLMGHCAAVARRA